MADRKKAKEMTAGSSLAMWSMNGTKARNPDDMQVRGASGALGSVAY